LALPDEKVLAEQLEQTQREFAGRGVIAGVGAVAGSAKAKATTPSKRKPRQPKHTQSKSSK
jgi:hypothetical protein